jgi:hypothetical protein
VLSLLVDEVLKVILVTFAVEIPVLGYYALSICTSEFTRVMVRKVGGRLDIDHL